MMSKIKIKEEDTTIGSVLFYSWSMVNIPKADD